MYTDFEHQTKVHLSEKRPTLHGKVATGLKAVIKKDHKLTLLPVVHFGHLFTLPHLPLHRFTHRVHSAELMTHNNDT